MQFVWYLGYLVFILVSIFQLEYVSGNRLHSNRTRRQAISKTSAEAVSPWQKIYSFSVKLSKAFGSNALLSNLNDMINTELGKTSKAYCGGGYGYGGRGGYGYGGYSYSQPPVVYYMQPQQEVVYVDAGNFDFTSGFGGAISNNELLEQLISLIESAMDESYSNYEYYGTSS